MNKKRVTYQERAERLAKAVDIAVKILNESDRFHNDSKTPMINLCNQIKQMALNPEPQFKKVASIKYLENDFLTYWNESADKEVDKFWTELYKNGIDFERKDTIKTVLKRGKIKDIYEYDNIVDNIVVAEQIGRINKEQTTELSQMIGDFENRNKGKDL
ncbi:hypothetical protein KMW28_23945 [Flammeovirga yaeyamensis]|uniref:Uncharacterized protein n=1 Tax=Flammeovirga yaeyamensis TaxID=367791 RepID=A0AAX1ND08_9BACT|nr:hypothetical protein [Flammeovirga yaeyamensis]MBB3696568.1 hypothetical protein [Flammeovirga yaeyamensis]NMF33246.1 hypothetical protein [Flammeovirga yaeyamensis]QWG05475.1 hypothetical protein KMW28_23945 [Flammeovirga yaeyamensis]